MKVFVVIPFTLNMKRNSSETSVSCNFQQWFPNSYKLVYNWVCICTCNIWTTFPLLPWLRLWHQLEFSKSGCQTSQNLKSHTGAMIPLQSDTSSNHLIFRNTKLYNWREIPSWKANYYSQLHLKLGPNSNACFQAQKIKSHKALSVSHQQKVWRYRFMSISQDFLLVW